jgi:hypothetical protein
MEKEERQKKNQKKAYNKPNVIVYGAVEVITGVESGNSGPF